MNLSAAETERYFRILWPLLDYVNTRLELVPGVVPARGAISNEDLQKLHQALWESDSLREAFIVENPTGLPAADLDIVASWKNRLAGDFYILRYLKKYTVFLTQKKPPQAYGVLGLESLIEDLVPLPPPVLVQTILLPFADKIIYNGMLITYRVMFGGGIRRSLNDAYREAQERGGIITSLQPPGDEDLLQAFRQSNKKILAAFRKDLAASGLSTKMIEEHAGVMETFAESWLLTRNLPRSLLDLNQADLQSYLSGKGKNANPVSFKRLIRFLLNTGRIDWDAAETMQGFLKQQGGKGK